MSDLATDLEHLASLGSWERPENVEALISEGLASPESAVRLLALELAAEHMDDDLADAVARLMESDPEPEVRGRAATVLGPALEEMGEDEDWEGADLDDLPLSEVRFHEIEARLEKVYRDAAAPKLARRRALEAAIRSPRPWHQEAVRTAWASDDPEWRLTAVFCMGHVTGFEAEILEALESDSGEIETEAVRAAGAMGIAKAGAKLASLAASKRTPRPLLLAAIEALGTVPSPDGAEALESLLDSDDEEIAEAAHEAYEQMEMWSQVEGLEDDGEPDDYFF